MLRKISFLFCVLFLSGCAGSAYQLPQVSDADVQAMQQKISKNEKPLKIYKRSDESYKQMLSTITKRLTKNGKPLCQYTGYSSCYFQVTYDPGDTVNAYASDNGKITVYKGLLQYLQNNDEMAAVVAHEMGHHLANHNEEKKQNAATGAAVSGIITAILLASANSNNPYYGGYQQQQDQQTLDNMMNAGAGIGALSYSKEEEREADLLATYLLSRAGYNLKRAENVMIVLSQYAGESDHSRASFLDTHPGGIERVVAWEKAIDEIKHNPSKLPHQIENSNGQPTEKLKGTSNVKNHRE